ncbi:hypothetical protein TCAL_13899 [Tigriopus californicus]|uniref:Uncharacterized protein n=1 Tax=Tigriopus californicus TaxID=6832 RepID=A0A553PH78_TIGCA|nr:oxytocin-neurophysin 1-like [Tigriopus californicus]XP_059082492.1 oxytocin-neurophysin 1-like [Tigriopus californicus]TRY77040.1 hypothetical protein TCAL_13899 [Tigriopus californicus]|eukprot:TCALIF_13899-PA protein Name:"Similar to Conopressin/neurophysin (Lymnaea stagnalis)" AED:0.03 eAED:0.03 QI:59/1/1/1/0.33/0.25/4/525/201
MQITFDRRCFIVLGLLSLLKAVSVNSCFITNCPSGGKKRSELLTVASRKCPPCGPLGMGQCFGPSMCCGQYIGCHLNTPDTQVCKTENSNPIPCDNDVPRCQSVRRGFCATNGFCCNDQGECTPEEKCLVENLSDFPSPFILRRHLSSSASLASRPTVEKAMITIPQPNAKAYQEALNLMQIIPKSNSALNKYLSRHGDVK